MTVDTELVGHLKNNLPLAATAGSLQVAYSCSYHAGILIAVITDDHSDDRSCRRSS